MSQDICPDILAAPVSTRMHCLLEVRVWHVRHMFHCFIDAGNIKDSIANFLSLGHDSPLGWWPSHWALLSNCLMRGHWILRSLSMFKGHHSLGDAYLTISGQVTRLDSTFSVELG